MTPIEKLQCDDPACKCRRPQREGYWLGHCPVPGHGKGQSDRTPSLLYRESYHYAGRLFVYCFAGCHPRDVYAALGVPQDRWWPGTDGKPPEPDPGTPPAGRPPSGNGETLGLPLGTPPAAPRPSAEAPAEVVATVRTPNQTASDARSWLAQYVGVDPDWLDALTHYGLLAFDGSHVCFTWPNVPGVQKARRAGSKDFFWQGDVAPPLWPEPGTPDGGDGTLYIAEGETDALVLLSLGLPAFAITKGASARPDQAVWTALKARGWKRIAILFDADSAGRQGAAKLAGDIREAGLEAVVLDLAGAGLVDPLRGQKDLRDAWRSGRFPTPDDFRRVILAAVRGAAEGSGGSHLSVPYSCPGQINGRERGAADLQAEAKTQGSGLTFLPFLGRPGYVAKGLSHLLSAYAKTGKTTLLAQVVAEWQGERVLWVTEEPEAVWKARLANLPDAYRHVTLYFAVGFDRAAIYERIIQGQETVIIIDTTYLLGIDDRNDASDVAEAILPLIGACRDAQKTLILVHHNRKGGGLHGEAIAGSHAFLALVDIALELVHDPQDARRRIVRGYGRVIAIPDLMIEMAPDGRLVPLGSPDALGLQAVKDRVLAILTDGWATLADLMGRLGDPKPSDITVRRALNALVDDGLAERDPPPGVRSSKPHRWRLKGADGPDGGSERGGPHLSVRPLPIGQINEAPHGGAHPHDGLDGLDEDPDLADIPEADPPRDDGELDFLIDGGTPEGPPWPADTFEPALNPGPVPCQACGYPIAAGLAVWSRLDPEGRLFHMNCAPVLADPDPPAWLPRCRACRTPMTLALTHRQAVFACPACQRRVRLRVDDPRVKAILDRITQDPDVAAWLSVLGGEIAAIGPEGGPCAG